MCLPIYMYAFFVINLFLAKIRTELLNPHGVPITEDRSIISTDDFKRGGIPKLLSDSSQKSAGSDGKTRALILYYSFENQKPGVAKVKDESGFDNNGIIDVGGMRLEIPNSSCKIGVYIWDQAIRIIFSTPDGVPEYGFSMSIWIKMLIIDGERTVLQVRGKHFGILFVKFYDKNAYFSFKDCNKCREHFILSAETNITSGKDYFDLDKWFHLTSTYNATTGIAQLYVDGLVLNRTWNKDYGPFKYWGNDVKIGGSNGHSSLRGYIDEVRFFNYELSAQDVEILSLSCCFDNCNGSNVKFIFTKNDNSQIGKAQPRQILEGHNEDNFKDDNIIKSQNHFI